MPPRDPGRMRSARRARRGEAPWNAESTAQTARTGATRMGREEGDRPMANEGPIDEGERLLQRTTRAQSDNSATAVADPPAPARPAGANGFAPPAGLAAAQAPAAAPRQRRQRRRIIVPLLAIVLLAAIVVGYRYWRDQSLYVSTDNAQVAGSLVQIGSINAGRLSTVAVDVGSTVRQDQVIAAVTLPSTLSVTSSGTPQLGFQGTQDQQADVTTPMN